MAESAGPLSQETNTISFSMEVEEDIEKEIETFVRFKRRGEYRQAHEIFTETLSSHLALFPVIAEYADLLWEQGKYRVLLQFLDIQIEYMGPVLEEEEIELLRIMRSLVCIHTNGTLGLALKQASDSWNFLHRQSSKINPDTLPSDVEIHIFEIYIEIIVLAFTTSDWVDREYLKCPWTLHNAVSNCGFVQWYETLSLSGKIWNASQILVALLKGLQYLDPQDAAILFGQHCFGQLGNAKFVSAKTEIEQLIKLNVCLSRAKSLLDLAVALRRDPFGSVKWREVYNMAVSYHDAAEHLCGESSYNIPELFQLRFEVQKTAFERVEDVYIYQDWSESFPSTIIYDFSPELIRQDPPCYVTCQIKYLIDSFLSHSRGDGGLFDFNSLSNLQRCEQGDLIGFIRTCDLCTTLLCNLRPGRRSHGRATLSPETDLCAPVNRFRKGVEIQESTREILRNIQNDIQGMIQDLDLDLNSGGYTFNKQDYERTSKKLDIPIYLVAIHYTLVLLYQRFMDAPPITGDIGSPTPCIEAALNHLPVHIPASRLSEIAFCLLKGTHKEVEPEKIDKSGTEIIQEAKYNLPPKADSFLGSTKKLKSLEIAPRHSKSERESLELEPPSASATDSKVHFDGELIKKTERGIQGPTNRQSLPHSFQDICDEIYLRLLPKFQGGISKFAPTGTAKEVLQPDILIQFFRSLKLSKSERDGLSEEDLARRVDEQDAYSFLAVLIFSSCNIKAARMFSTNFLLSNKPVGDIVSLPIDKEYLRLVFHDEIIVDRFSAQQVMFCPVIIHSGKVIYEEDLKARILPYLEESLIDQGASSAVYKVKIAKWQLYDDRLATSNNVTLEAARKDYTIAGSHSALCKKYEILEWILNSDKKHEQIVDGFGIMVTSPGKYSLLMPLALCDLDAYMMEYKPEKTIITKQMAEILLCAQGLAEGLCFLHDGLKAPFPSEEEIRCYDLGLKPSNILLFEGGEGAVGKLIWKICGFNSARIDIKKAGNPIRTETFAFRKPLPFSSTYSERDTFSPPESFLSPPNMTPSSDIWSLGCVLSVVITYLELGAEGVKKYSDARSNHPKSGGKDRFFISGMGYRSYDKKSPIVRSWHKRVIQTAQQTLQRGPGEKAAALKKMLEFLESSVLQPQSRRCDAKTVEHMLGRTYKALAALDEPEGLPQSKDGPDDRIAVWRNLFRPSKNRHLEETESHVHRWICDGKQHFRDFQVSPDGETIVFWTETGLALFTSTALLNGKDAIKPQSQFLLDGSYIFKRVRLTNRYLIAIKSEDNFQVLIFDLDDGPVSGSLDHQMLVSLPLPEISDIAISSDGRTMACILLNQTLYIANVTSPGDCQWKMELDWPSKDITNLSFPTHDDIYFLVHPMPSDKSHERDLIIVHISLISKKRLSSIIMKYQHSTSSKNPRVTFAPLYKKPHACAIVTEERKLFLQDLAGKDNLFFQQNIIRYCIHKLMTGPRTDTMLAIGRASGKHKMILLEIQLPRPGGSDLNIRELGQLSSLSDKDQFTCTLVEAHDERFVLLAAVMDSAKEQAIYKVQLD